MATLGIAPRGGGGGAAIGFAKDSPFPSGLFSFISRGQSIRNGEADETEAEEQREYRRYRGGKASPLYKRKTEETTRFSLSLHHLLPPLAASATTLSQSHPARFLHPPVATKLSQIPFGRRDATALCTPTPFSPYTGCPRWRKLNSFLNITLLIPKKKLRSFFWCANQREILREKQKLYWIIIIDYSVRSPCAIFRTTSWIRYLGKYFYHSENIWHSFNRFWHSLKKPFYDFMILLATWTCYSKIWQKCDFFDFPFWNRRQANNC